MGDQRSVQYSGLVGSYIVCYSFFPLRCDLKHLNSTGLHYSKSTNFQHYTVFGFLDDGRDCLCEGWCMHVGEDGTYELFFPRPGEYQRDVIPEEIRHLHVSSFYFNSFPIFSCFPGPNPKALEILELQTKLFRLNCIFALWLMHFLQD